ncbi:MAG: SDR family NAD(P)-dependent oxidoreductase, partial [Alistipes sp.]|nr:SDR family NAD(P)-dependent oxidoreductase [Alistipes sp.]
PKLDEIWVIARRKERLVELAEEVPAKLRIFDRDLMKEETLCFLEQELAAVKPNVRMLVNSAGFGLLSRFTDGDRRTWENMIDLNCKVLTGMTYMALPYMGKGARVLNVASSAAFVPQPGFDVYAAGKAYVLSFSRALNAELTKRQITVTAVCPGPVRTEFFQVADPNGETAFFKKLLIAEPRNVVFKALDDARLGKDVSVYGNTMRAFRILSKLLPHRIFIDFMG